LAEDAVQETLLAAWRSAASYQGHSSASTWLFGICRHKVADALRRRDPAEAAGLPEPLPIAGSRDPDLRACLGRLEEDDRELLVLVFHYGFAQREVAEVMGLPVGTVKSRVFYARRKLQALLEEGG
jgi:RNA polymerase sigma-70 factor (ECF subfamily)